MRLLSKALAIFSGALLVGLVLLICINVFMRYGLNSPVIWADQVTGYFLVYMTFLASPWVLAQRKHISVDILREILGMRGRAVLSGLVGLAGCLYCLMFTYLSVAEIVRIVHRGSEFRDIITVPQWAVYWTLPVGFLMLAVQFALNGLEDIREYKHHDRLGQ
jgi:TRAP-type C4-dicarboxylate transport system permease small subunit